MAGPIIIISLEEEEKKLKYKTFQNNKTKGIYWVEGLCIDATNAHNDCVMVIYRNNKNAKFVRQIDEFYDKFTQI